MLKLLSRREYRQEFAWKQEANWYQAFVPQEGLDYKSVLEFAQEKYDEIKKVHEDIDRKAEWCFGLAIAATGALVAYTDKIGMSLAWCSPTIVVLLVVMWLGLRAKIPGPRPTPFSVRGGIERAENTKQFDAWLCASLHCTISGMEIVTDWKSRQIQAAARLIVVAIGLLFAAALLSRITWRWPVW